MAQVKRSPAFSWNANAGRGFYPCDPSQAPYDGAYFAKYQAMSDTPVGRALTEARVELVRKHRPSEVCDVGIGSGAFVEALNCHGFDVNPVANEWLDRRGAYLDPWTSRCEALTFWDSLEHIEKPEPLLAQCRLVFVSLPVFDDAAHAQRSKHFRPTEHYHYFTPWGFIRYMDEQGFQLLEANRMESDLGREDIGTFVFQRRGLVCA